MKKILFVLGTRPEAIKLAPVILELRKNSKFEVITCVTAQHRQMLDQILTFFQVRPDIDLDIMQPNQSLASLSAKAIEGVDKVIAKVKPDTCVVQGDTSTVFAAALAAYYNKVPLAHVEAGLRTYNKYSPFPEEINRVLTGHIADWHFAPTASAKENLTRENIPAEKIFVTGNTVIDALLYTTNYILNNTGSIENEQVKNLLGQNRGMVLITSHRRENFGDGINAICTAILRLAKAFPQYDFVYPVHLNPNIQEPVTRILSGASNIILLPPLDYVSFVALMNKSYIILTDSGGVQEEAPSLGKPILVMRDTTERPEAISAGAAKLVGTNEDDLYNNAWKLLTDKEAYKSMSGRINPYGDGLAAQRIAEIFNSWA
ncbi:MAG: UDP-N-acetylglucosamine 2-epimerase (non-hydrolyzing) [Bacteroidota bacterium]